MPSVEVFGFQSSLSIFNCSEKEDGAVSERLASQDVLPSS